MDLALIKELERNPLASNSELGLRLYASRNTIARRVQTLLSQKIISISVIRHISESGTGTMAYFFINASGGRVNKVAEALSAQSQIDQVNITTGQYDIMAFGKFHDNQGLLEFLRTGVGGIQDVAGCQTMIILAATKTDNPLFDEHLAIPGESESPLCTDELALKIIDELDNDPRQNHTVIAKQLGVSRQTISRKIHSLLSSQAISIATYVNPMALGYQTLSVILLKVRPGAIDKTAEKLAGFPEIQGVFIGTGQYDIIAFAVFQNVNDLSTLVRGKLGAIKGVLVHETIVVLHAVKSPFGILV